MFNITKYKTFTSPIYIEYHVLSSNQRRKPGKRNYIVNANTLVQRNDIISEEEGGRDKNNMLVVSSLLGIAS